MNRTVRPECEFRPARPGKERPRARPPPGSARTGAEVVGGGVLVMYVLARLAFAARGVLTLIGLALFLAVGLDPLVRWLQRRGLPRWAGVAIVAVGFAVVGIGVLAAAVPPLVGQATKLVHELPGLAASGGHGWLGRLITKYHLQARLHTAVSSVRAGSLFGGLLGAAAVDLLLRELAFPRLDRR